VHADEKLTTFVELEFAIRVGSGSSCQLNAIFSNLGVV